jgi:hypothetical protein
MAKKLIASIGGLCMLVLFTSCPSEPMVYARILIETFPFDSAAASTDTILTLYDSSGTELATETNNVTTPPEHDPSARIDYQSGLDPGVYFIRVSGVGATGTGPYVIRAVSLEVGDSIPGYSYPGTPGDDSGFENDDNAPGNIPTSPVDLGLGNANQKNRYLDTLGGDVADWLRLELP